MYLNIYKKIIQMTGHIAIYKAIVLCMVCSCMNSSMLCASNEYNSPNEVMDEEWMRNIDINDLYGAIPTEHYNSAVQLEYTSDMYDLGDLDDLYPLEGISESAHKSNTSYPCNLVNLDTANQAENLDLLEDISESENTDGGYYTVCSPNSNNGNQKDNIVYIFYKDIDGHTFYINSAKCKIYIYPTGDIAYIEDIFYIVYRDSLNNLVYINSSVGPSTFNIENTSKDESRNQGEILFNSLTKEAPLKRLAESTSSGSDDNLSAKKCKNTEFVEESHKDVKNKTLNVIAPNITSRLYSYNFMACDNSMRDNPHGFSYWFPNSSINNENIPCKCKIESNYEIGTAFWHLATSAYHNSLTEKIDCISSLNNASKDLKNAPNIYAFYHYLFLEDLNKYIETHIDIAHISAKYDYTDRGKNNICSKSEMKSETLGEIYEETQTDLKWWANSMSIISAKTEEIKSAGSADAALKEKLHLILKLPEVLRDLVLITPEILLKTKREMEKAVDKKTSKFFCIIEYLYYLVNNHTDKMNRSYKKVYELIKDEKPIYAFSTMVVYKIVYDAFCLFYQCAPFTCVADIKSKKNNFLKKEPYIKSIFQTHYPQIPQNGVFRLHGKRAIVRPKIKGYIQTVGRSMLNQQENQTSELVSDLRYFDSELIENTEFLKIASSDHYHVQLVDNARHTVKLIPIPMINPPFTKSHKDRTHSIWDIVEYIKSILKSTYPEKSSDFNVYPFKYSRRNKSWTILDKCVEDVAYPQKNKDATIYGMNKSCHDIVFYYFEKDIRTTKFALIEFIDPIVLKNSKAARIPLFLTDFMVDSTLVGPYKISGLDVFSKPKYSSCYKNIKTTKIFYVNSHKYINSQNSSAISSSGNESQSERSYTDYYYSDFLIRNIKDCTFCTVECFSMFATDNHISTFQLSKVWCTQIKRSVREYTNYCFHISAAQNIQSDSLLQCEEKVASTFLDTLQRKSSSGDKVTYGLCIYTSLDGKEVAVPIMCEKMRKLLSKNINGEIKSKYTNWESDILPPRIYIKDIKEDTSVFITVKTFNYTQANLGIHYDIIAALFYNNNNSALAPTPKKN
ncbi:hypothetical protein NERG_02197 [Nematocida ausubeli]|uniref:Uncharacterized protein n=1 Tax=Nematocida ausubeli (strain ATCC PRA-371 / ERTm2) TaxID=1913371 RepID=H8ZF28_NEMA1|nr:hypothetical protein NERG_02197 [Nematocida ausubeli]